MRSYLLTLAVCLLWLLPSLTSAQASPQGDDTSTTETRVYDFSRLHLGWPYARFQLAPPWPLTVQRLKKNEAFPGLDLPVHPAGEQYLPRGKNYESENKGRFFTHILELVSFQDRHGSFFDEDIRYEPLGQGQLRVTTSKRLHERLRASLQPLRQWTDATVQVEVVALPTAALEQVHPRWSDGAAKLTPEQFARAVTHPESTLHATRMHYGQWTAVDRGDVKLILADHDINQTGVVPVSQPIVSEVPGGDRVELRMRPLPDAGLLWIDVALGRYTSQITSSQPVPEWGRLQLPSIREGLASVSTVLADGEPTLIAHVEEHEGLAVIVRARRARLADPLQTVARLENLVFRYHPTYWLTAPGAARRWPGSGDRDPMNWISRTLTVARADSREGILAQLFERTDISPGRSHLAFFDEGLLGLLATPQEHARMTELLEKLAAAQSRTYVVELERWRGPKSLAAGLLSLQQADALLPADWGTNLEGIEIERQRHGVLGVAGIVHGLRSTHIRTFLAGADMVSGGTGFAIVERADPLLGTAPEGVEVGFRVDPLSGGDTVLLQVIGARAVQKRPNRTTLTIQTITPADPLNKKQTREAETVPYTIDMELSLPQQLLEPWEFRREVPLNRHVLLDVATTREGGTIALIARVREAR